MRLFRDHEAEQRAIRAESERIALLGTLEVALAQIAKLTRLVANMKRQGFDAPAVEMQPPAPPPTPDPFEGGIRQAITERSEPGSIDRRILERWAQGQLEKGADRDQVAKDILVGEEV